MFERENRPLGYIQAIDGLRAVAVLSVILYHLSSDLLPAGFVGVDIFFVISGFVVAASIDGKTFRSFSDFVVYFYKRRVLRIFPPLVVMLLATSLVAALFLPDMPLSNRFEQTAIFAFFGLSNLGLASSASDYFEPAAALNPFLHTWSLGVEEQFYLLFPLLMYLRQKQLRSAGNSWLAPALLSILVGASLYVSARWTETDPNSAFFLLPSRFWELGLGVLLLLQREYWMPHYSRASSSTKALTLTSGLSLLGASLWMDPGGNFPFPFALMPVIGTSLIIVHVVAESESRASRVLSSLVPRTIGRWSYSLYLWHWPIFVIIEWTVGLHGIGTQIIGLGLTFLFGWASFRFLETPFRNFARNSAASSGRVLSGALTAVVGGALLSAQAFGNKSTIGLSTTNQNEIWQTSGQLPAPESPYGCDVVIENQAGGEFQSLKPVNCSEGGGSRAVKLFAIGDSHNLAYTPNYLRLAAEERVEVWRFWRAGCAVPKIGFVSTSIDGCDDQKEFLLNVFEREVDPGDIVFFSSLRLPRIQDKWIIGTDPNPAGAVPISEHAAYANASEYVDLIVEKGGVVIFEAPKPVFGYHPFRCSDWFNRTHEICRSPQSIPRSAVINSRKKVMDVLMRLAEDSDSVKIWDPLPIICPQSSCSVYRGTKPLFFDGDHISGFGNEILYASMRGFLMGKPQFAVEK